MPRPPSILLFERLYLGSLLLTVIGTVMFWSTTRDLMLAMPNVQGNDSVATLIPAIMVGTLIVTLLASLLIWWLVARAGSVIGKWLAVGTEALGALFAVLAVLRLVRGTTGDLPQSLINLAASVLAIAAAAMLFRADAQPWFRDEVTGGEAPRP